MKRVGNGHYHTPTTDKSTPLKETGTVRTCKITIKSASWEAFADPKIELVVSLKASSSFRGCITSVMWTFFSVANLRNLSKAASCTVEVIDVKAHSRQLKIERYFQDACRHCIWAEDNLFHGKNVTGDEAGEHGAVILQVGA